MRKNNDSGGDDEDSPGDPYEGSSDDDRAWLEVEEKRQAEEDTLAEENRRAEYDRNSRYDEDDRHDD